MDTKELLKQAVKSHYEVYMEGYKDGLKAADLKPCDECNGEGGNNAECKKCKGTGIVEISEKFFKQ